MITHNIENLDQCAQYVVEAGFETREGPITHCDIETGRTYIVDIDDGLTSFFADDCTIEAV